MRTGTPTATRIHRPHTPHLAATLILALGLGLGLAGPAQAAPGRVCGLVDLGTLGGRSAHVTAVNERGQAVGYSETSDGRIHAFLWQHGVMTDLDTLDSLSSAAVAINDRGQVVGGSVSAWGEEGHPFVWEHGRMRLLGVRGGAADINNRGQILSTQGTDASETASFLWTGGTIQDLGNFGFTVNDAVDLNDRGEVVGRSSSLTTSYQGYLWRNGRLRNLAPLPVGHWIDVSPSRINNRGQVAGTRTDLNGTTRAFRWQDGVWTDIGPAGQRSSAVALNQHGDVGGTSRTDAGTRGFVFRNGRLTLLPELPGPAGVQNVVDINNHGQVIGDSTVLPPGESSGIHTNVLWQHGRAIALPGLGYQGPEAPGDSSTGVVDINDRGQIVAHSRTPAGDVHAIMMQAPRP
jgi:probable HAF family extracellular repeat protein